MIKQIVLGVVASLVLGSTVNAQETMLDKGMIAVFDSSTKEQAVMGLAAVVLHYNEAVDSLVFLGELDSQQGAMLKDSFVNIGVSTANYCDLMSVSMCKAQVIETVGGLNQKVERFIKEVVSQ